MACGYYRCTSAPFPNPFFSVSFVSSAVNPPDRGQESNHRELKGLREPVDFKGVRWNRLGGRKGAIWKTGCSSLRLADRMHGHHSTQHVEHYSVGGTQFGQLQLDNRLAGIVEQGFQDVGIRLGVSSK